VRTVLVADKQGRPRRVATNGVLMTIGAVNSPCGNAGSHELSERKKELLRRVAGGKTAAKNRGKRYKEYTLSLDEVSDVPGIEKAIKRYTEFHGSPPSRVRVFEYDDGLDLDDVRLMFKVGTAEIEIDTVEDAKGNEVRIKPIKIGTVYTVGSKDRSNKAGTQWIHSHREDGGKPPIHAVDVDTGVQSQLGGSYEHRDWIRR
jgi:hypothetical protein